jgi:hypothetical protein
VRVVSYSTMEVPTGPYSKLARLVAMMTG